MVLAAAFLAIACEKMPVVYMEPTGAFDEDAIMASCEAGSAESCFLWGAAQVYGDQVAKSETEGWDRIQKACDKGFTPACTRLGEKEIAGDDVKKAYELLSMACRDGDAKGCNWLADMYQLGLGTEKNMSKAHKLYERNCLISFAKGCFDLARLYHEGNGVEKNVAKSVELVTKACDLGSGDACFILGQAYMDGKDVTKDLRKAGAYIKDSCEKGKGKGCHIAGALYSLENPDSEQVLDYYRKGCDLHDTDSCEAVVRILERKKAALESEGSVQTQAATLQAYGIAWEVTPAVADRMQLKKVECDSSGNLLACQLVVVAPSGLDKDVQYRTFDEDGVQLTFSYAVMSSQVSPGVVTKTIRLPIAKKKDRPKRVVLEF